MKILFLIRRMFDKPHPLKVGDTVYSTLKLRVLGKIEYIREVGCYEGNAVTIQGLDGEFWSKYLRKI